MPSITDIRNFLSNLPEQRVGDDTIRLLLRMSKTLVDSKKSACASSEQLEDAQIAYASYMTMLAYASQMERSTGVVPAPVISHLAALEILYKQLIEIIERGAPTYVPMNEQWDSIIDQYVDGELSEDYY